MWFLLSEDVVRGSRGAAFCGVIKLSIERFHHLLILLSCSLFPHLSFTDNVLILPEGLL